MAKRGEPDWTAIRQDYVVGQDSYRQIALRYGLAYTTVRRRGVKEDWPSARHDYALKQLSAQAEAQGRQMAEGLRECVQLARKMLRRIDRTIESDDYIGARAMHDLSDAVNNLRLILQSDLDVAKKKADIEKLRRDMDATGQQEAAGGVIVVPEILPEVTGEDG